MIGFLIRKTIYDLWDNLFRIALLNLGFIVCLTIPVFLPSVTSQIFNFIFLDITIAAIGILVCSIYLAAASFALKAISDDGVFSIEDFFTGVKRTWPAGIAMGVFVFLLVYVFIYAIPSYMAIDTPIGLGISAIIFWTMVFALLSFQYYFTVYNRLNANVSKALKKCMLLAMDNTGFSFFMIIHNTFALLLSMIFALLFPGPVGILLYLDQALRLRLLKYDWLEANPTANRRKIPWDVLLIDEREKTGTRSLRNFIFPWKD